MAGQHWISLVGQARGPIIVPPSLDRGHVISAWSAGPSYRYLSANRISRLNNYAPTCPRICIRIESVVGSVSPPPPMITEWRIYETYAYFQWQRRSFDSHGPRLIQRTNFYARVNCYFMQCSRLTSNAPRFYEMYNNRSSFNRIPSISSPRLLLRVDSKRMMKRGWVNETTVTEKRAGWWILIISSYFVMIRWNSMSNENVKLKIRKTIIAECSFCRNSRKSDNIVRSRPLSHFLPLPLLSAV